MLKYLLAASLLLVCQLPAGAAVKDSASLKKRLPEGFVSLGYGSELWIVGHQLNSSITTATYTGKVTSLGGGFRSRVKPGKVLAWGLSADFLHYTLDAAITKKELVPAGYSFLRIMPELLLHLPGGRGKISYFAAANAGIMLSMQDKTDGYAQAGLRLGAGYKYAELSLAYQSSKRKNAPATLVQSDSWREQMFTLNASVFPGRIKGWKKVLTFLSSDRK